MRQVYGKYIARIIKCKRGKMHSKMFICTFTIYIIGRAIKTAKNIDISRHIFQSSILMKKWGYLTLN